jgi:hypothetical protein
MQRLCHPFSQPSQKSSKLKESNIKKMVHMKKTILAIVLVGL